MSNPIDEALEAKEKHAKVKLAAEMHLFSAYQENKNQKTLGALLDHFKGEIDKRVNLFKAPNVDKAAFKAELHKQAIGAFDSFNPDRGASLKTHLTNRLKRSQRFNANHQNLAYIPEEVRGLITPVQQSIDNLRQFNGTMPSHGEIATYLNENPGLVRNKRLRGAMTPTLVQRVQEYQIADIPSSGFESDPFSKSVSPHVETLSLLRSVLKEDEREIFDYMMGENGKPKIVSTGQIARRLGKSDSQISRIKGRIENQMKKYM